LRNTAPKNGKKATNRPQKFTSRLPSSPYIPRMAALRPLDLVNRSVSLAGLRVTRNVPYGPHARNALDVYTPRKPGPVLLFFYGGGWQSGERADYAFIGGLFAARGFVVMVADYRVYPEVVFPDFVEDSVAAARFAAAHAIEFNGTSDLFLIGHSAGAYNAAMAALAGGVPVAGVVGLAGPYDFLPLKEQIYKNIFAPAEDLATTQPINFVTEAAPPMLLLTGGQDRTVLPRNSTALAAKLRALGAPVETKIYPRLGHISLLLTLLPYLAWRAPVLRDILAFLAACRDGEFAEAGGVSENQPPMVGRSV
jgi:acetyl esterase/lipase